MGADPGRRHPGINLNARIAEQVGPRHGAPHLPGWHPHPTAGGRDGVGAAQRIDALSGERPSHGVLASARPGFTAG